jgi:hypothetical protein
MIGKILGAVAGAKAAEQTTKIGGAGGALLGVAAMSLARRLSVPALIVLTAGGYAFKKWNDKNAARPAPAAPAAKKRAPAPRKPAARKTTKAAKAA